MNLAFIPHKDFLSPYVEAAGSLSKLSDEFFDHLAGALGEEGYAIARILTTRRASSRLDIRRPLVLVADFADEMRGKEVLVELVVELEPEAEQTIERWDEGAFGHLGKVEPPLEEER